MNNERKFLISIPDGPVEHINMSWAESWINIWDNGGIGYEANRFPTKKEKRDIRERIAKYRELLKKKEKDLDAAWNLMK